MNRKKRQQSIRAEYLGKPDKRLDYNNVLLLRDANESLKRFATTPFTYSNDEMDAAVQHWFLYLFALVTMTADSVAMLALNRQSLSAFCLQRQVVEYVGKALYFDAHPEEAWFQFHYAAKDKLSLLRDLGKEHTAEYAEAQRELETAIKKCPPLAQSKKQRRPVGIADIMKFHGEGKRDIYAHLFRYPSFVLHAHPLGMSIVYETASNSSLTVRYEMSLQETDALILDLAWYVIRFGQAFDGRATGNRFADQWGLLQSRFLELQRRYDKAYSG